MFIKTLISRIKNFAKNLLKTESDVTQEIKVDELTEEVEIQSNKAKSIEASLINAKGTESISVPKTASSDIELERVKLEQAKLEVEKLRLQESIGKQEIQKLELELKLEEAKKVNVVSDKTLKEKKEKDDKEALLKNVAKAKEQKQLIRTYTQYKEDQFKETLKDFTVPQMKRLIQEQLEDIIMYWSGANYRPLVNEAMLHFNQYANELEGEELKAFINDIAGAYRNIDIEMMDSEYVDNLCNRILESNYIGVNSDFTQDDTTNTVSSILDQALSNGGKLQ